MSKPLSLSDFFRFQGRHKQFFKGENIFMPGDARNEVMLIESGAVKVYDIDKDGSERTASLFGAKSFIPISWLIKEEREVLFFYEASVKTEVYSITITKALDFIGKHPDILLSLLDATAKGYVNQDARIYSLQRSSIQERVEFILYYLAIRLGTVNKGVATVPMVITQQEISNLVGTSRESVSRELNKITGNGKMKTSMGKTYIDLNRLDVKSIHKIYGVKF